MRDAGETLYLPPISASHPITSSLLHIPPEAARREVFSCPPSCRGNSTDLVPWALEAGCSLRQLFIAGSQGAAVQGEGTLTVHACLAEQAGQDLGMVLVSH